MNHRIRVGIIGATGYTGICIAGLLNAHPKVQIEALCSQSRTDMPYGEVVPSLSELPDLSSIEVLPWSKLDCVFAALPNGEASYLASRIAEGNCRLIDLSADFRLKDPLSYSRWYSPLQHPDPRLMAVSAYGLTEWNREAIASAKIIANPGCYPTASALAITPLLKAGVVSPELCIIDAKSGVTGAGRRPEESLMFGQISESMRAYKVSGHRHTPEIIQILEDFGGSSISVRFTPQLVPMKRGIMACIYMRPKVGTITNSGELAQIFQSCYAGSPFVHLVAHPPSTGDVHGTNRCHIYVHFDEENNLIVLISAIDNLIKGAAGQAIQNFNVAFGLPEQTGLTSPGTLI